MSRLASATQGLASPGAVNPTPPALARHLALQQGWPITLDSLPHWLLALAALHCAHLLPGQQADAAALPMDVSGLALAQGWARLRATEGTVRLATGLAGPDPGDQALLMRYRPAPEHYLTWRHWLAAWADRSDTGEAAMALQHEWGQLQPTLQRMAAWHQARLPTPPQQAWALARHACLTGQADVFVADTLAAQARWQAQTRQQVDASDWNRWLGHLAPHADAMDRALLQCLQQGSRALLQQPDTDPAQAWQWLESGRFSLLSAVPGALPAVAWDERARAAVNVAAQGAVALGEACWAARQEGRPPWPGPLTADLPAEPFATLAREWQRLGVDLPLPGPAPAARHLAEGEVLAQFWWDEQGAGHALLLGPQAARPALRRLALPAHLGSANWQALLTAWQQARAADAPQTAAEQPAYYKLWAAAWQALAASTSPACGLLRWLQEAAPGCRWVLVMPAQEGSLPWQALVDSLNEEASNSRKADGAGARAPALSLAASVSAWCAARARAAAGAGPVAHLDGAVVMAQSLWDEEAGQAGAAHFELAAVSQALRCAPQITRDGAATMRALMAGGPVHLAMQGVMDAQDPQRAGLEVDRLPVAAPATASGPPPQGAMAAGSVRAGAGRAPLAARRYALTDPQTAAPRVLPAWLLDGVPVHGDISLPGCDSMLVAQGDADAALLGPVGLGAMLSACGARTVTGSLWACNEWAAAMFFQLWFEQRRRLPAGQALTASRQALRGRCFEDFAQRVQVAAPLAAQAAQGHADTTRALGWAGPFAHPWCWAAFAMLGEAPAVPGLAPPKTASSRWAWIRQFWQRVVRRSR